MWTLLYIHVPLCRVWMINGTSSNIQSSMQRVTHVNSDVWIGTLWCCVYVWFASRDSSVGTYVSNCGWFQESLSRRSSVDNDQENLRIKVLRTSRCSMHRHWLYIGWIWNECVSKNSQVILNGVILCRNIYIYIYIYMNNLTNIYKYIYSSNISHHITYSYLSMSRPNFDSKTQQETRSYFIRYALSLSLNTSCDTHTYIYIYIYIYIYMCVCVCVYRCAYCSANESMWPRR